MTLTERAIIPRVVVHLLNEQAFTADLYAMPTPNDVTLVCTNVRTTAGKRPVWADAQASIFYIPWAQIRFIEISQEAMTATQPGGRTGAADGTLGGPEDETREPELEIDEEFLRRVRDV